MKANKKGPWENKPTSPEIFMNTLLVMLGQCILEELNEGGKLLTSLLQARQVIFYSIHSFFRRVQAMKGIS